MNMANSAQQFSIFGYEFHISRLSSTVQFEDNGDSTRIVAQGVVLTLLTSPISIFVDNEGLFGTAVTMRFVNGGECTVIITTTSLKTPVDNGQLTRFCNEFDTVACVHETREQVVVWKLYQKKSLTIPKTFAYDPHLDEYPFPAVAIDTIVSIGVFIKVLA